ncbi:MAG: bifunctional methylenetetrahydrofolate dehydrogenase/methenyltetrahydrofolate cyclohydrolase FolD [Oscillospiraceae bacterium]|nr:bifunctional methylenetetrahydrofolate dehydrogenase/methenyltetrahydrofolate cyclohydrolase FolD [Oscillospiraceae bacterium]
MAQIIDGKQTAKKIRDSLKIEVDELKKQGVFPKLAVIMVGNDPSSRIYVRNKSKACEEIGITYEEHLLCDDTNMEELLNLIEKLNNQKDIHGILLQSPIPKHLDVDKAFRAISPNKDVDGFNPINVGKLCLGQDTFISCTPFGVIKLLEEYNIEIEGKNAVVIGRSNIVGKPMFQCLLDKNATVTICHSRTKNLQKITSEADIIVAAIGKPKFVTKDMVKENAVVIDVGINRLESGKICGDVDYAEVAGKAAHITPVPGGVGPMTIAMLMHNVVKATKQIGGII